MKISAMSELLLQLEQQLHDLRLGGHVERGGGLVGDQQLGPAGERHGDHDALPHAAGQLVRVLVEAALGGGDADQAEQLDRLRLRLATC